jgi:hypothetical protein
MRKGLHHWVLIQHMPVVIVVLDKVVACHVRLYESEPAILHLDDPTRQKSEVTLRQLLIELARNIPAEGLCLQRTIRASTNQIPFFPSWIIKKSQVSTPRVRACKLAMLSSKYASRLARFLKNLTTSPSLQSSLHAKYTLRVGWGGCEWLVLRTGYKGHRHGAASNPASSTGTLHRLRSKPAVCALVQLLPFDAICPLRALPYFCPCAEL